MLMTTLVGEPCQRCGVTIVTGANRWVSPRGMDPRIAEFQCPVGHLNYLRLPTEDELDLGYLWNEDAAA